MKIHKISLMAMSLGLLVSAANAEFGNGLGNEKKCSHISSNQQSGWWGTSVTESKGSECESKCCCCGGAARAESRGLATEQKDAHVGTNQQSGWWFASETPMKCETKAVEKPKAEPVKTAAAPAPVVAKAPVDSDGDGVIDEKDNCEGTPKGVKVDEHGCPQEAKAVPESNWTLAGVQFETGSDKLKKNNLSALNEAAEILKTHTRIVVEIQGHTDNIGGNAANQALSEKRAAAVKQYLIGKGVSANRLEARGYGESVPVADNKTPAGRAQNRRIDFKVITR